MRPKLLPFLLLSLAFAFGFANQLSAQPKGKVITVNHTGDTVDAVPGDGLCSDPTGKCTLRAAITESNASPAKDAIIFDVPVPAIITLNLGELTITNHVAILGRGARRLTVQRNTTPNFSSFRIFNITASAHLRGMTISNGHSFSTGGGILTDSPIRLYDLAIAGNRAVFGGGFAIQGQGSPLGSSSIERCLFNGNTAGNQGGGVYIGPGMGIEIASSTFAFNTARVGGGMAVYGGLASANNTIASNSASESASSIENVAGGIIIVNTIIGPDSNQTISSVSGNFSSGGKNFVTNTTNSTGWRGDDFTSPNNSIDPLLAPLANNGGQTDSFALLPGSPAIDAGNMCVQVGVGCGGAGYFFDLFYDQRKSNRWFGSQIDIGALESGSPIAASIGTLSLFSGMPTLAQSRVIVTDTETMERRYYFVITGLGTAPVEFDGSKAYLIEIMTKRKGGFDPGFRSLRDEFL